jgi:hypothetical protein
MVEPSTVGSSLSEPAGDYPIGAQTVAENGSITVPVTVQDASTVQTNLLIYTTVLSNTVPNLMDQVYYASSNLNIVVKPAADMPSKVSNNNERSWIGVTAADTVNGLTNFTQFQVTVQNINQAPCHTAANTNNYYVTRTRPGRDWAERDRSGLGIEVPGNFRVSSQNDVVVRTPPTIYA